MINKKAFSVITPLVALFLFLGIGVQAQNGVLLPKGFPQYQDTGDREADGARYQAQKEAWIKTHPEEYAALKPVQSITILEVKDFPTYQVSDNKSEDDRKYDEAKHKWIQEHPEEYQKLAGNPARDPELQRAHEKNTMEERKSEEARLKALQPNR